MTASCCWTGSGRSWACLVGLIFETGNMFSRKIILALVETDRRTRVEVVEQVKRNMEEFLRIENVVEFIQMVFAIDGVQGPAHSQGSQNRTQAP